MKLSPVLLYTAVAMAAPAVEKRQAGGCTVGFVFARGSTEPSPIGMLVGPGLQTAIRAKVPGLKTFPVMYAASLGTNMSPQRTDAASIAKGQQAFQQAAGCKTILAGGYSQGAAVMHNVVGKLSPDLKNKVAGVALFGSTRNKQDNGHIPGIPEERSKTWCNKNDGVCGGGLNVNAGHMSYNSKQFGEAAAWLASRVSGAKAGTLAPADSAPAAPAGSGEAPKTPKAAAPKGKSGAPASDTAAAPAAAPKGKTAKAAKSADMRRLFV